MTQLIFNLTFWELKTSELLLHAYMHEYMNATNVTVRFPFGPFDI